jgi:HlyD family secretion protein
MLAIEQLDLAFEVGGTLIARPIQPGQTVKRGDVLARLDDVLDRQQRAIRARELDVANADLALLEAGSRPEDIAAAKAELVAARASERTLDREEARQQRLVESGVSPPAVLDDVGAQVARARGERESLEARVSLLRRGTRREELVRARARVALAAESLALEDRRLDKRVLTAPQDGVILDVYPDLGEVLAAGAPVLSLVDRSRPYADVFVPVAVAPTLHVGDPMQLTVEGVAAPVAGRVELIAPHAEFTPRFVYSPRERPNLTVRVRVRVTDPTGSLHAGLPVYAAAGPPSSAVAGGEDGGR